jgi:hypothetical protein
MKSRSVKLVRKGRILEVKLHKPWPCFFKFSDVCSYQASLWGKMMKSLNYKPGWWALYFVYCAIPIGIYVRYLWRRVAEVTSNVSAYCSLLIISTVRGSRQQNLCIA